MFKLWAKYEAYAYALLLAAAFLCSLRYASQMALVVGFFIDEAVDTTAAAVSFFRHGLYSGARNPDPFDPHMSTGLPVTWLSGLLWVGGSGSLFLQRHLLLAWHLALLGGLVWLGRRELGPKVSLKRDVLAGTALVWLWLLSLVPNWQNLMLNLGEFQAAIFIGCAYFLRRSAPMVAGVFLGTAVWGCKFVVLPAALALLFLLPVTEMYFAGEKLKDAAARAGRMLGGFFVYPLAYMLVIASLVGVRVAFGWPMGVLGHVLFEGTSGILEQRSYSLAERLSLPSFEWASYTPGMKGRILLLLALPILLSGMHWAWARTRQGFRAWFPFFVVMAVMNSAYAYWWFFRHPTLIYRHLQSALVISALASFAYFVWWCRGAPFWKWGRTALCLLFAVYFVKLYVGAQLPEPSGGYYAKACRENLFTVECFTPTYFEIWREYWPSLQGN